ncbi:MULTISPECIES: hypothetical protein [Prauserella salsuginis group]|uniref:Membrane protein involved in the export of O-antigen and teichoic acid n=1 Tax=Prauserella salsuginis TaxID=387889 RepID=A0ABW6GBS4_9PSEU|nr:MULTISPECIES: hypothetical protein [Prauserella salsuginis group]MCR3721671.1 hypothetical protein [Prauserella flava]MCR3734363.1 hypothetical protein [Prauserella salsuginis]
MTGAAVSAAPRRSMMLRLLLGRGSFRASVQVMQVALAVVWGTVAYGPFANALGACAWLVFLPNAAEKSALRLAPRVRATRATVAALAVRFAAAPVLAFATGLIVTVVVAPESALLPYLAAACWHTCSGMLMTVAGLHRLRGRAALDAWAFTAGAVLVLAVTLSTWLAEWSPRTVLLVLPAGLAAVALVAVGLLPRDWRRPEPLRRRRFVLAYGRTTWLLGVPELLDALTVAVVFFVLAAVGRVSDSGPFYLAMLAAGAFCSIVRYQFRIHQPGVSLRQRGAGAVVARAKAMAILRAVVVGGAAFAVLFSAALLVPTSRDALLADTGIAMWAALGVLTAVEIVTAIAVMYGIFLIENTGGPLLGVSLRGALCRLLATTVGALCLVPPLGAAGGFAAVVFALSAEAAALHHMVRRRPSGPPAGRPARSGLSSTT